MDPTARATAGLRTALLCWALAGCQLLAGPPPAGAQQPAPAVDTVVADTLYRVEVRDGSTFYGRIVEATDDEIVLRTEAGARVELDRSQLRSLEPVRGRVVDGEVWPADRNATRLFFGPTGRALPRGAGYLGVFELFFPFVAVGATDRIILAGGTPVLPVLFGEVWYAAPKVTLVSASGWNLAAGALALSELEFDLGSVGVVYGTGTYGDADGAVTLGAGWGFQLSNDAALSDDAVVLVGGERRVSRRVKLVTENYLIQGEGALVSGGVRLLGERFSGDLGLGAALEGGGGSSCCLPVLSVVYAF